MVVSTATASASRMAEVVLALRARGMRAAMSGYLVVLSSELREKMRTCRIDEGEGECEGEGEGECEDEGEGEGEGEC